MKTFPPVPFLLLACAGALPAAPAPLAVTEAMANSSHLDKDINGDWFEIANTGSVPLDLDGYSWDDNHGVADFATFPAVTLAPGEFLIVLDESDVSEAEQFRAAWSLPAELKILTREDFSGSFGGVFNGLGTNDAVVIFQPDGAELVRVTYPAYRTGVSNAWFTDGNPVPGNFSEPGKYGAVFSDQNPADLASPGTAAPGLYRIWVESKGLTGANALKSADPDHDGRSNFSEYMFGGNPAKADAAPPQTVTQSDGQIEWTLARRNDDPSLVFVVQASQNLADWENQPFEPDAEIPHPALAGHVLSTFRFAVEDFRFFRAAGE